MEYKKMVNKKAVNSSDWKFLFSASIIITVVLTFLVGADVVWQTWGAGANLTNISFATNATYTSGNEIDGIGVANTTLTSVYWNISITRLAGEGSTKANNITEVNIILPKNWTFTVNTNVSDSTNAAFPNASFENTTMNLTTGQMLIWPNATLFVKNDDNDTANTFGFEAITNNPGTYNITVLTINGSGADNTTYYKNLTVVVGDIIAPHVNWTSGSGATVTPPNYSNLSHSGIVANLSWSDAGTISAVNITLFNTDHLALLSYYVAPADRGHFNDTYTNFTNATGLAEGVYYLNITWMNDTMNNINHSGILTRKIMLDRTAPTVTFSCTPTTDVNIGETVICTCSGNDTNSLAVAETSGVRSITYNSTGTTSLPESVTETCTIDDYANNTASSTVTYTVYGSGNGGSGGGGGGSSTATKTVVISDGQFSAGHTTQLKANEQARMRINGINHYVSVGTVSANTVKITVSSDPQEATLSIGDTRKFDVGGDGFYDISVTLNAITGGKADLTILSISEEVTAESEAEQAGADEDATGADVGGEEEPEEGSQVWIWVVIIIVVLIIVGVIVYKKNKS